MKLKTLSELVSLRALHDKDKIVLCHGVFDLFHQGHLRHLRSAKSFGDVLVVSITPDEFVNKGPGRPKFNSLERAEMLAAIDLVDYVVINSHPTAVEPILSLKPDIYVKGPDYKDKSTDKTGGIEEEDFAVQSVGGELRVTEDKVESSSRLLNANFMNWNRSQRTILNDLKEQFSIREIEEVVEGLSELKVLVVGEPIIDTYVFCQPENLSSKSPSISARFIKEENYPGGSLAVARHLCSLGCDVGLLSPMGTEGFLQECLDKFVDFKRLKFEMAGSTSIATPRKTRYISPFMNQRMFEVVNLDEKGWIESDLSGFETKLRDSEKKYDLVLALDFGHGLWVKSRIKELENCEKFVALNVQTNSSNQGFNLFHKHKKRDFLVLDERELRLGLHDRYSEVHHLLSDDRSGRISYPYSVTLGGKGSVYINRQGIQTTMPSFFTDPVDTIGAGDAYFAISSLLQYRQAPDLLIPFIGNLFAGLKTKIIGNKESVDKSDLIRSISHLLK